MNLALIILSLSFLWLLSEILLGFLKRSPKGLSQDYDKASIRILWITILVSVSAGIFISMTGIGYSPVAGRILPKFGIALIALGLVLRWAAILTLRRYFTVDVAIVSDHKIIERGFYNYIRHPSYLGSLISFAGLGLALSNYLSLIMILIPILVAFLYRIRVEEAALIQAFGDDYKKYIARTKRLIPGIY
jgi:protein-S-isoprenylcysteine O-methyltransferase Ste14